MKNFLTALALSAAVLLFVGCIAALLTIAAMATLQWPQYGIPALVFVWMALAWGLNTWQPPKLMR